MRVQTDIVNMIMSNSARLVKTEMKYVTGPREQFKDCPKIPAHIALDILGVNNYVVPIVETDKVSFTPVRSD